MKNKNQYNFNYAALPEALTIQNSWVGVRLPKKIPVNIQTGQNAENDNPETWVDYETALRTFETKELNINALGYEVAGGRVVIFDLDNVINEKGELYPPAAELVKLCNSYTEISSGGHGLHIVCGGHGYEYGKKSFKEKFYNSPDHKGVAFECFSNNGAGHYIIVTGNIFQGMDKLRENQEAIETFYSKYIPNKKKQVAGSVEAPATATKEKLPPVRDLTAEILAAPAPEYTCPALTNAEIIDRIKAAHGKRGKQLKLLFEGKKEAAGFSDDSAADQSLANGLAFYARKNVEQIDAIFRVSGLMRDKWDKVHRTADNATYGSMTIEKAIKACKHVYGEASPYPVLDQEGKPLKSAWENLDHLLDEWHLDYRYNELTRHIEDQGKIIDIDIVAPKLWGRCNKAGLGVTVGDLKNLLPVVAYQKKFNPWQEYLSECRQHYLGGTAIDNFINALQFDNHVKQDIATAKTLIKKWFIQAIRLAFNDSAEVQCQFILVLVGPGGIGKTRLTSWLLKDRPKLIRTGANIAPNEKDSLMKVTEFALVEVGELPRSMKDKDGLKAFITQSSDTFRRPWGHGNMTYPRYTSYIATANDRELLLDDFGAGDRRYICVALSGINWAALMKIAPADIWGEAMKLALEDNLPYWLDKQELDRLNISNQHFKKFNSYEVAISDRFNWKANTFSWQETTATEICERLGFKATEAAQVARALNNFVKSGQLPPIKTTGAGRSKVYTVPPVIYNREKVDIDNDNIKRVK